MGYLPRMDDVRAGKIIQALWTALATPGAIASVVVSETAPYLRVRVELLTLHELVGGHDNASAGLHDASLVFKRIHGIDLQVGLHPTYWAELALDHPEVINIDTLNAISVFIAERIHHVEGMMQ